MLDIAHDGNGHRHILGDGRGVDIDVDDPRVGAELLQIARHAVVEARADGDQHIALVHGHVRLVGAVHPQHADELLVGGGVAPQAHERIGDGVAQQAGEFDQLLVGLAEDHAAASVDHRFFRRQSKFDSPFDLPRMTLDGGAVGAHLDALRVFVFAGIGGDILGDVNQHGAGAPAVGDIEGLFDGHRQILHIADQEVVLDAGPGDADGVDFLKGVVADDGGRHLPAENHQGNGIHVGRGDPGDGVGDARARGHQHHPGAPGGPGVAVGGVGGPLLVAHQDMLHLSLLVELVVNVQHGAAGVAEQMLHPLVFQGPDENLRAAQHRFRVTHFAVPQNLTLT